MSYDKVKRYAFRVYRGRSVLVMETTDGEYVKHTAYAALEAERDRLRMDIKTIKDSLEKHTVAKRNIEDGISEITVRR